MKLFIIHSLQIVSLKMPVKWIYKNANVTIEVFEIINFKSP